MFRCTHTKVLLGINRRPSTSVSSIPLTTGLVLRSSALPCTGALRHPCLLHGPSPPPLLHHPPPRNQTCGDYIARAAKVITLVDLAGHEKYFRTTAYGLTGE